MTYAKKQDGKKFKKASSAEASNVVSGGSGTILFRLYRDIHHTLIGGYFGKISVLTEGYLNDPRNAIPNNVHARSSARGNLNKELQKHNMSWRVFCKGMRFLNIFKFELIVRTKQANGRVLEFGVAVNLGESMLIEEADEQPKKNI